VVQFEPWARYFQFSKSPILTPIQWVPAAVSPWVKHLGCETCYSTPSCVKKKDPVTLHLHSLICPYGMNMDNFNFTITQTQAKQLVTLQTGCAAKRVSGHIGDVPCMSKWSGNDLLHMSNFWTKSQNQWCTQEFFFFWGGGFNKFC
jgi:hypothetical protein